MSDRYQRLLTLPENIYADGAPLIIAAGALLKDTMSGKVLLQLKLRSIADKTIKAAYVEITPLDTTGKPLGGVVEHQYLDLLASRDDEFGSKNAIFMPDSTTRGVEVRVTRVCYTDNTEWLDGGAEWSPLVYTQLSLSEMLGDGDLVDEYRIKYGDECEYEPKKVRDLWVCSCGHINPLTGDKCKKCGASLAAITALDIEMLKASCTKRVERERAEAAAQAEIDAKKRRRNTIITAITVPLFLVIVAIVSWFATETLRVESKAREHVANGELASAMQVLIDYNEPDKTSVLGDEIARRMYAQIDDAITYHRYAEAMESIKAYESYIDTTQSLKKLQYWCKHSLVDIKVIEPSCTEEGQTARVCTVCEAEITEFVPTKGHSEGAAPTCTQANVCGECGEVLEDMLPHKYISATGYTKEPTCTAEGETEEVCTVCGHVNKIAVEKIPHSFSYVTTKEATCTAEGETEEVCTVCGHVNKIAVEKIPHSFSYVTTKEATCTAEGETKEICSVCGKTEGAVAIAKIPHDYETVTLKAATCTSEGSEQKVCRVCGEKQSVTATAKLPHKLIDQIVKQATCTDTGIRNSRCTVCGHEENSVTINAFGHGYTSEVTVQPTCTATGTRVYTCQSCGDSYSEAVDALGHAYSEATCSTPAICSRCNVVSGSELGHYWSKSIGGPIFCDRCRISPPALSVNAICNDLPLSYSDGDAIITLKSFKMNPLSGNGVKTMDGKIVFGVYNITFEAEITRVDPQSKSVGVYAYLCVDIYDANGNYIVGHRPEYLGYALSSSQVSKTDDPTVTSADQDTGALLYFDDGGTYIIKVYFKD